MKTFFNKGILTALVLLLFIWTPLAAHADDDPDLDIDLVMHALEGESGVVADLILQGVDVNTLKVPGFTPLIAAVKSGHTETTKILIDYGADVNAWGSEGGQTALTVAVHEDFPEIVALLLENGADPLMVDEAGRTAMLVAALEGRVESMSVLLANGAVTSTTDSQGNTALILAAGEGNAEVIKMLLEAGADKATENAEGVTALSAATTNGHKEVAALLK